MSDYGDPFPPDPAELAVERALDLNRAAPERSLDDHVRKAISETICTCAFEIGDDLERHLCGTHSGILDAVRHRVELRLGAAPKQTKNNPVDEASEASFPASDPRDESGNGRTTEYKRRSKMVERTSAAEWHGRVQDGGGCVSLGSGAFEAPYSFGSRFEEEAGTNPEELLGAAHASCFSMALSLLLTEAGYTPARIRTLAKVRIERSGNGFAITHIALVTEGEVPGLDARTFSAHAEVAKRSCPVSKALAGVDISLTASLLESSGGIVPRRSATAGAAPQARTQAMSRRGSERFQEAR